MRLGYEAREAADVEINDTGNGGRIQGGPRR